MSLLFKSLFNAPNGTDLSTFDPNWIQVAGSWQINDNAVQQTTDGWVFNVAYYNVVTPDDQSASVIWQWNNSDGSQAGGPAVRCGNTGSGTGYALYSNGSSGTIEIMRLDGGTNVSIATAASHPTTGQEVKLSAFNDTITLYYDGVEQASGTDSTYTSGFAGIAIEQDSSNVRFTAFSISDFAYEAKARWLFSEADSGNTPTTVFDNTGNGNDLTIDYSSGDAEWTTGESGNGLDFIAATSSSASAIAILSDIQNNGSLGTELDGASQVSGIIVTKLDTANDNGMRLFGIGTSTGNGDITVTAEASLDLTLRFDYDSGGTGGRCVFDTGVTLSDNEVHVITFTVDTNDTVDGDWNAQARMWVDGVEHVITETNGTLSNNHVIDSINATTRSMFVGNRPSLDRNIDGAVFYAEIGTGVLTASDIANYNRLLENSDENWDYSKNIIAPDDFSVGSKNLFNTMTQRGWNSSNSRWEHLTNVTVPKNASHLLLRTYGASTDVTELTIGGVDTPLVIVSDNGYSSAVRTFVLENPKSGFQDIMLACGAVNLELSIDAIYNSTGVGDIQTAAGYVATSMTLDTAAGDLVTTNHVSRQSGQTYSTPLVFQKENDELSGVTDSCAGAILATSSTQSIDWVYDETTYSIAGHAIVFEADRTVVFDGFDEIDKFDVVTVGQFTGTAIESTAFGVRATSGAYLGLDKRFTFEPDGVVSIVAGSISDYDFIGVAFRMDAAGNGYVGSAEFGDNRFYIKRYVAGVATSLGWVAFTPTAGDLFSVEFIGDTFQVYQNNTELGTPFVDATHTSGKTGIFYDRQNSGGSSIDDYQVSNSHLIEFDLDFSEYADQQPFDVEALGLTQKTRIGEAETVILDGALATSNGELIYRADEFESGDVITATMTCWTNQATAPYSDQVSVMLMDDNGDHYGFKLNAEITTAYEDSDYGLGDGANYYIVPDIPWISGDSFSIRYTVSTGLLEYFHNGILVDSIVKTTYTENLKPAFSVNWGSSRNNRILGFSSTLPEVVDDGQNVTGADGEVSLEGSVATITVNQNITGADGEILLEGSVATITIDSPSLPQDLTGADGEVSLEGSVATITVNQNVTGADGEVSLEGSVATITVNQNITGADGEILLEGSTRSVEMQADLTGVGGEILLEGSVATITVNQNVTGADGEVLLEGSVADITIETLTSQNVTGADGEILLEGSVATITVNQNVTGADGEVLLEGSVAAIDTIGLPQDLTGADGEILLEGSVATITVNQNVTGADGEVLLEGSVAAITVNQNVTGADGEVLLEGSTGLVIIAGTEAPELGTMSIKVYNHKSLTVQTHVKSVFINKR